MNVCYLKLRNLTLILAVVLSVLACGCATQPARSEVSSELAEIEGRWFWSQNPWHGYFVLEKDGDSYSGTLDDLFEGTYGDTITDVNATNDSIKFTRHGRFGVQYWEGTLKRQDDLLKIVDGRWEKQTGSSGPFYAEKRD